ncbi:hypothetical protein NEUTE1DRAFT_92073 [Neurospora tetrasperma FGSC 2508]|uniref:Uncharacterized protein n=1 Tax=Neurospora tetrasperma (strain FGSC 2508 / ATCC MYA-4615 / P0657) TaxID=510951 RepID=F8N1B9_NEUT8|nr:uncharacterized protein NEUTE1DRAFT_92073 [Neurospora tetrasperma FGSC 2508]EGO53099.1 hypothetical protein NEUTE1DRAFT_92073 [Neurospora tetrasperma FGSC 2508]
MAASESIVKPTLLLSRIVSREIREYSNCTRGADGFIDPNSCYVPFWYTRWLVARDDPRYPDPQTTFRPYGNPAVLTRPGSQQQQQPYGNYGMYPVPPPVYDPDAPRPPMYPGPPPTMAMAMAQPPDGATKVDPMQQAPVLPPVSTTVPPTSGTGGDGNERYEAPPGPPPSIQAQAQTQAPAPIRQQGTGGTNPFRD